MGYEGGGAWLGRGSLPSLEHSIMKFGELQGPGIAKAGFTDEDKGEIPVRVTQDVRQTNSLVVCLKPALRGLAKAAHLWQVSSLCLECTLKTEPCLSYLRLLPAY